MSFNHRYIWSTTFVKDLLRRERLSEAVFFWYFFAVMTIVFLTFTMIAVIPNPQVPLWSAAGSWADFAVYMFSLPYLYLKNGGAAGKQFMPRYFPLNITVSWKFVVAMIVEVLLVGVVLAGESEETLGWSIIIGWLLTHILTIWRIGFHLKSLSNEAVQTTE